MKNLIFLFLIIISILIYELNAETIFWEESFDYDNGDWTLEENWSIANGKLELYWSPSISPYDLSAISSIISLPYNIGNLIVTQHINVFSIQNEVAEIIAVHNGNQDVLWSYQMINGNWGEDNGSDIVLPLADYADEDIQIEFRSYGNSTYNINWWDIFQVTITALFDNDMVALGVEGPTCLEPGESGNWTVEVKNGGLLEQDSYTVQLCQYGGDVLGSFEVNETLLPGEIREYSFDWTPADLANTGIYCAVQLEGDDFNDNNTSPCNYLRIAEAQDYSVLVWDNDNNSDYYHPETGAYLGTEMGIKEALDKNNITYTSQNYLPPDLSPYDIVFVALGIYCVG